ncbi:hypothetical protein [Corynebacterium heidelbergense]|uniref:hypothetical protein n=1 Tax=Corynebacterium heidelbergense TaxID=2055947 RepID=UPI00105777D8|nr:hypothetical protein [Corynebacterium heidelbergense]
MNKVRRRVSMGLLTAAVTTAVFTPQAGALGQDDRRVKDELGTYTVKCEVHKNSAGDAVVGFVYGNSSKSGEDAEQSAGDFVSLFGPDHTKRHCETQLRYTPVGAYNVDGRSKG